ncbi:MAG: branched-chain amino acid ABC transporter permease [Promethearchaeota archaeon]
MSMIQLMLNIVALSGIYIQLSIGLTLVFGVLNIINMAHGEFIMLGMYVSWFLFTAYNISPIFCLPIVLIVFFIIGMFFFDTIIKYSIKSSFAGQLFLTIGVSLVLRSLVLILAGADYRHINIGYAFKSFSILGGNIGMGYLIGAIVSLCMTILLFMFLYKTIDGKAIRAVACQTIGGKLVGINVNKIYKIAFSIGISYAGVAGVLLIPMFPAYPSIGWGFLMLVLVIVVLGGSDSLPGTYLGAVIVATAEVLTARFLAIQLTDAVIYLVFLLVLLFRPTGIMGKRGSKI